MNSEQLTTLVVEALDDVKAGIDEALAAFERDGFTDADLERIKAAQEREFYEGGRATDEWLEALAPIGTDWEKPFLETVPWIVVVFAQNYGLDADGAWCRRRRARSSGRRPRRSRARSRGRACWRPYRAEPGPPSTRRSFAPRS